MFPSLSCKVPSLLRDFPNALDWFCSLSFSCLFSFAASVPRFLDGAAKVSFLPPVVFLCVIPLFSAVFLVLYMRLLWFLPDSSSFPLLTQDNQEKQRTRCVCMIFPYV